MNDELYRDIINNNINKYFYSNDTINIKYEFDNDINQFIYNTKNYGLSNNYDYFMSNFKVIRIDITDIDDDNQQLERINLENDITHLEIIYSEYLYFPFDIKNMNKLEILKLTCDIIDDESNNKLPKIEIFPSNLKYLNLGENYNHILDNLPNGLITLIVSNNYNYALNSLPTSLISLYFNSYAIFNKPLDNLPSGLKKIYFESGCKFNQEMHNLPKNLESLGFSFNCVFNNSLNYVPSSLKILKLYNDYNIEELDNLPIGIEKLYISGISSKFINFKMPENLKYFTICLDDFNNKENLEYLPNKYPFVKFQVVSTWVLLGTEEF